MDWLFTYADPNIDWNYASITLVVRFIGVFFVMGAMQVALQISSRIVQRIEAPSTATAVPVVAPVPVVTSTAHAPAAAADDKVDDTTAAAIGMALALEARPAVSVSAEGAPGSPWASAGRIHQLQLRQPR